MSKLVHVDANGNWVGDKDLEYDEQTGLYWHAATQSWGDRNNSDAVNNIVDREPPTNPGYTILGTAGIATQLDSPVPGPADAVAAGIAIYGLYKLATWTSSYTGPHYWEEIIPRRKPFVDPNIQTVTDKIGKIATDLGWTEKRVRDAIHKVKKGLKGGPRKNPDVVVDTSTGEVYPKNPDGTHGDSIGNIHSP